MSFVKSRFWKDTTSRIFFQIGKSLVDDNNPLSLTPFGGVVVSSELRVFTCLLEVLCATGAPTIESLFANAVKVVNGSAV